MQGIELATVEALKPGATLDDLSTVELACIADDAQGELLRAVLESEIDVRLVQDDLWQQIAREGPDDPKVLAAHMRAIAWKSATAADCDLFQAPRRVDFVVVSAPGAMITQWQDELAQKFGLSVTIVDREYLAAVRRVHGFAANPWAVGSRFISSFGPVPS